MEDNQVPGYKNKWFIGLIIFASLLVIGSFFGSDDQSSTSTTEVTPIESFASLGCLRVSDTLLNGIATGLLDSKPTGKAAGFVSTDFKDVKMVAIEFIPNGLSDTEVAVFATSDSNLNDDTVDGLIFPADGFAKSFSDWGDNPNLGLSAVTAGVSEAKKCLDFVNW